VAGVEKTDALHADQRQLADVNNDGARGVVDLRFHLVKVFGVELADQLEGRPLLPTIEALRMIDAPSDSNGSAF
jgi:hypothetical protein